MHEFAGKLLLAWSILQAKAAKTIDAVFVSSDSRAILDVAPAYGAVPIVRPEALSTDAAAAESALLHALDTVSSEYGGDPDTVVFLQAASPLREPDDMDGAVTAFRLRHADCLCTDAVLATPAPGMRRTGC